MSGWAVSHRISERAVIDLLRSQTKKPAAIIVIGGNDEATEKVTAALGQSVGINPYAIHELSGVVGVDVISDEVFQVNRFLLVNFVRGASSMRGFRHAVVQRLRAVGAKTVAIVWVKGDPTRDNPNAHEVDEALRSNPPTIDDADYLFTIEP